MTPHRFFSVGSRVLLASGLIAIGLWPAPAPAKSGTEQTAFVPNVAESWYVKLDLPPLVDGQPELPDLDLPDVCDLLGSCEPVVIPNPGVPGLPTEVPDDVAELIFPAETLHVEMSANRPVSRAFVVPNFALLPAEAEITAAQMVLPLSTDPLAMNSAVETARFEGCLATSVVPDGEQGRLSKAPDYDCDAASTPAVYDAKGGRFTLDLMPLVRRWIAGAENFGVALVPVVSDAETAAADPGSTFHVGFNGSNAKGTPGAESLITYTLPAVDPQPEPTPGPSPGAGGGAGGGTPVTGGGITTAEPPPAGAPATAPETAPVVPGTEALQPSPYALINSPWYTYRGVVFLPLAFLVALSLTGRSLTRPLSVTRGRRG